MKTITLHEAVAILENCSAVIVDDSTLIYPSLTATCDDEDNDFLYLAWEDDGLEHQLSFKEGHNQSVEVVGSSMFLVDSDGEHIQLTILDVKIIE